MDNLSATPFADIERNISVVGLIQGVGVKVAATLAVATTTHTILIGRNDPRILTIN